MEYWTGIFIQIPATAERHCTQAPEREESGKASAIAMSEFRDNPSVIGAYAIADVNRMLILAKMIEWAELSVAE